MSADGPNDQWTNAVIAFLKDRLPRQSSTIWSHGFQTSYQHGCDALVALGQAEPDANDAAVIERQDPILPDPLPRWDDICVAVTRLSRISASKLAEMRSKRLHGAAEPNVAAFGTAVAAYVGSQEFPVFECLGLIENARWTAASETVLWRSETWMPEHEHDLRFVEAVRIACETMPDDIEKEMDRLVTITDDDLERSLTRDQQRREREFADRRRRGLDVSPPPDVELEVALERARKHIEWSRSNDLGSLFEQRWRFSDGWLTTEQKQRALYIFHDRLAGAMSRAVVKQRYDGLVLHR